MPISHQKPWYFAYPTHEGTPTKEGHIVFQHPATFYDIPKFIHFFYTEKEAWDFAENNIREAIESNKHFLAGLGTHPYPDFRERYEKRLERDRAALEICERRKAKGS